MSKGNKQAARDIADQILSDRAGDEIMFLNPQEPPHHGHVDVWRAFRNNEGGVSVSKDHGY